MVIYRLFVLLILTLLAVGCDSNVKCSGVDPLEKGSFVSDILWRVAYKLRDDKQLYAFGNGGCMMDEVRTLSLAFKYYKKVDIAEGRELLMYAMNIFVKTVNETEPIRKYLINDPFLPKNIGVEIYLLNPDGSKPALGELMMITSTDGIIRYTCNDPETKWLTDLLVETYDEAAEKINAS